MRDEGAGVYRVTLDEAVVCACAHDPERLQEVNHRWLYSTALGEILRAMQAIHRRGEAIDFDSLREQLKGRVEKTRGGWWGVWGEWWSVMRPPMRGRDVDWPTVREQVREAAVRRTVRTLLLRAAIATHEGELANVPRLLERAGGVVARELERGAETAEAAE